MKVVAVAAGGDGGVERMQHVVIYVLCMCARGAGGMWGRSVTADSRGSLHAAAS